MAVQLMTGNYNANSTFTSKLEDNAVHEAAAAGIQSVEKLIHLLSQTRHHSSKNSDSFDSDYKAVADVVVKKFRKVISLLDRSRTGHARFRRGPIETSPPPPLDHQNLKPSRGFEIKPHGSAFSRVCSGASPISQRLPPLPSSTSHQIHAPSGFPMTVAVGTVERKDAQSNTINFASSQPVTATSYMSSLTGDTDSITPSMSSGFQITNPSNVSSAGKPPSWKRKCSSVDDSKCGASSGRCHCSKRKKSRVKRVVRVPAISVKMADIPPDNFSWRKYGQKPIKGSPHPRGYYKCSSVRGCPARKHVERALDDPSMLIVAYEGDHNHSQSVTEATILNSS
ncbi:hypothetical protein V2J09_023844 [Rumex salicifolius]